MIEYTEAVTAALTAGENVIAVIRDASGYSVEQLSILSGLAVPEIADLEAGRSDPSNLGRLLAALGLPTDNLA